MKGMVGIIVIALAILLIGGCACISAKNALIGQDEAVTAAWSQVDNQLKRRSDLIPQLVETVKGITKHENEVFKLLTDSRARLAGATDVEARAKAEGEVSSALSRLLAFTESNPELKSSQNFAALQDELAGTENRIAVARKTYNEAVRRFNTSIRQFPGSIFAGQLGFSPRKYFEVEESAKAAPQIKF